MILFGSSIIRRKSTFVYSFLSLLVWRKIIGQFFAHQYFFLFLLVGSNDLISIFPHVTFSFFHSTVYWLHHNRKFMCPHFSMEQNEECKEFPVSLSLLLLMQPFHFIPTLISCLLWRRIDIHLFIYFLGKRGRPAKGNKISGKKKPTVILPDPRENKRASRERDKYLETSLLIK